MKNKVESLPPETAKNSNYADLETVLSYPHVYCYHPLQGERCHLSPWDFKVVGSNKPLAQDDNVLEPINADFATHNRIKATEGYGKLIKVTPLMKKVIEKIYKGPSKRASWRTLNMLLAAILNLKNWHPSGMAGGIDRDLEKFHKHKMGWSSEEFGPRAMKTVKQFT